MNWGPLNITHLAVDAFDNVVVDKQFGNVAVLWGFGTRRWQETGGDAEEAFGQRDGQINGVGAVRRSGRHRCAGKLGDIGHGLVHIFTWTE